MKVFHKNSLKLNHFVTGNAIRLMNQHGVQCNVLVGRSMCATANDAVFGVRRVR